jgi:dienelactone hydrolase
MPDETFTSDKSTVYPGPTDGKKYPILLVLHGLSGLDDVFGPQIKSFAQSLAGLGYVAAVPQYFAAGTPPESLNPALYLPALTAVIAQVAERSEADATRVGFVGYSFGAATAMTYIATDIPGKVKAKVLVDFYGPTIAIPAIKTGVAGFPPTIIFHNRNDKVVDVGNSKSLNGWLAGIGHNLVLYDEKWPAQRHHPFEPNKAADLDSRRQAAEWVVKHLPPVGR